MTDFTTTNGCGIDVGWLGVIRPPHYRFFDKECTLHDEMYNLGGTEADRRRADRRLYDGMVTHARSYYRRGRVISQWWFITLAMIYYYAVRAFGRKHFNY